MRGYGMKPWRPAGGDERLGEVAGEGQGISVLAARHDDDDNDDPDDWKRFLLLFFITFLYC